MKEITVKFHLEDSAYITALRLVAGAVCSAHDVDLDTLEDFKVCVTESAIILKNCGFEEVEVTFVKRDFLCCEIAGVGGNPCGCENEFSIALISALVKECDFGRENGIINKVTLKI